MSLENLRHFMDGTDVLEGEGNERIESLVIKSQFRFTGLCRLNGEIRKFVYEMSVNAGQISHT